MDDRGKITPEKQLLKIIEDPKSEEKWLGQKFRRRSASWFSLGALKGRLSFLKHFVPGRSGESRKPSFDMAAWNRMLMFTILGLGGILVISFAKSILELNSQPVFDIRQGKGENTVEPVNSDGYIKPLPQILAKVRSRDIFKMGEDKKTDTPVTDKTPEADPRAEALEAVSHLKLVGISWSGDPDAMIEDTKAVRTFFVKKGQKIGPVTVVAIFKEKIVLEYKGQEVELK